MAEGKCCSAICALVFCCFAVALPLTNPNSTNRRCACGMLPSLIPDVFPKYHKLGRLWRI